MDHAFVDAAAVFLDKGGRVLLNSVVTDEIAAIAVDREVPHIVCAISVQI